MVDRDSVFESGTQEFSPGEWGDFLQVDRAPLAASHGRASGVAVGSGQNGVMFATAANDGMTQMLISQRRDSETPAQGRTVPAGDYPLKRVIDIVGSAALLALFAPLMLVIALVLGLAGGGPILFRQERIGRGGGTFRILKFRTMRADQTALKAMLAQDADLRREWADCQKLARDPRVTPLGRVLRVSSLDELPQLINVLKGEMSLVGPRPIVSAESARYGRHFADYCAVKPGLTGLWQVSGRNSTTYRRRVAMDVAYGRNVSLGLDLGILLRTVPAVFLAHGY